MLLPFLSDMARYRCASDSSPRSEDEGTAGNIVQRSSAMRTTTWAPRSRARQPKAWNAGGGPVDGWFQRHGWRVVRGQDRVWVQAGGTSGRAALQSKWAWLCDMCVTIWVFDVVA